jgi:protein-S-isoprenylcysteine O-methyltransferase Ste14
MTLSAGTIFWVVVLANLIPLFAPRWFRYTPPKEAFVAWDRSVVWIRVSEIAVIAVYVADVYFWRWTFPLTPWPRAVAITGLLVTLPGVALTIWSKVCLGNFFSTTLGIKRDHQLLTTGPYRFVRHPMYSGLLLVILGGALVYNSGAAVVLLLVPFAGFFYWQSAIEEKLFAAHFGEAHARYRAATGRLLPRLRG